MKTFPTIIFGALCLLFSLTTVASSTDLKSLYGQWGNASQCKRALITPNGTKHFTPFDIQQQWLAYGGVWCRLTWSAVSSTPEHLNAIASALCGEDTERDYQIKFSLANDKLTLTWYPDLKNGPLMRCTQ